MSDRKKILFIGEAVSLAHVTRPLVLALSLDPSRYEIHFACDPRYHSLLKLPLHIQYWPIHSSPSESFIRGADRGGYVWQPQEIEKFVQEELGLFARLAPALIVSDFRMSVTISAELARIPYATLTNIYWSPFRRLGFDAFPTWPLQFRVRRNLERWLMPWRQTSLTAAFNQVRQAHDLPLIKGFLHLITRGNYTLYAEPPGLVPTESLPAHHVLLGPVVWSPRVPYPPWWQKWDSTLPVIYITLGSTGAAQRLPKIIDALQNLPVTLIVATAGRIQLPSMPPNVLVADYLPGAEVCRLAAGVVCNGGSPTAYQALSEGTPVVGIWSNLDQYLNMSTIERAGAGLCVRASHQEADTVHRMVSSLLQQPGYRAAAQKMAELFGACDATREFPRFLDSLPELAAKDATLPPVTS